MIKISPMKPLEQVTMIYLDSRRSLISFKEKWSNKNKIVLLYKRGEVANKLRIKKIWI